jgi:hypothetical protein
MSILDAKTYFIFHPKIRMDQMDANGREDADTYLFEAAGCLVESPLCKGSALVNTAFWLEGSMSIPSVVVYRCCLAIFQPFIPFAALRLYKGFWVLPRSVEVR